MGIINDYLTADDAKRAFQNAPDVSTGLGAALQAGVRGYVSRGLEGPAKVLNAGTGFISGLFGDGQPPAPAAPQPTRNVSLLPSPGDADQQAATQQVAQPKPVSGPIETAARAQPPAYTAPLTRTGLSPTEAAKGQYDAYTGVSRYEAVGPDGTKRVYLANTPGAGQQSVQDIDANRQSYDATHAPFFNAGVADDGSVRRPDQFAERDARIASLFGNGLPSKSYGLAARLSQEAQIARDRNDSSERIAALNVQPGLISANVAASREAATRPLIEAQTQFQGAHAAEARARAGQLLASEARTNQLLSLQAQLADETDPAKQRNIAKQIALLSGGKTIERYQPVMVKDELGNPVYAGSFDQTSGQFQPHKAAAVPAGMKQVGTSGGKPVYQDANGKKFIGE